MRALLLALPLVGCASSGPGWDVPEGFDCVYDQDFATQGARAQFDFSEPDVWGWHMDAEALESYPVHSTWLEAERASTYAPPFRSPRTIALIEDLSVGSFVYQLEVMNTAPVERGSHRDLCFFFGFQDPANFYYVHLAPVHMNEGPPDDHAHNIFLVNDAARVRIADAQATGIDWGTGWHQVRIERMLEDGTIRVFFDDMETPVLEATDSTHGWGRIGFGTFDDAGRFTNLLLFAPEVRRDETANPFE